jgi:hypothetical protein
MLSSIEATSLEDAIDPNSPLPTVVGTHVLTSGDFRGPASWWSV